jgi:antitoxin YobK
MDFAEFVALAEPLRQRSAAMQSTYGFALIEGQAVTADEIARIEVDMAVTLPENIRLS